MGTPQPKKETAWPLFEALRDGGHPPVYTDHVAGAAGRIRNEVGGHGAGGQPRQIDQDIAVAAVALRRRRSCSSPAGCPNPNNR
jgi:hypothetical protein